MGTRNKDQKTPTKKNESPDVMEDAMDACPFQVPPGNDQESSSASRNRRAQQHSMHENIPTQRSRGADDSSDARMLGSSPYRAETAAHSGANFASAASLDSTDLERYNMQHKRRGLAIIFNHENFEQSGVKGRQGADKDGDALQKVLRMLSFEVRYYKDLSFANIKRTLYDVSMEDHSDADCFFVAVMTHGEKGGYLYAKDTIYDVENVWKPFTADKVVSLAGKPKIFLFQACRGNTVEESVWVTDATDSVSGTRMHAIPTMADFILAYSTMEGFYSWRNPVEGSWFIQEFCNELRANGRRRDLMTMLTFTLRRVAFDRVSHVPNNASMHEKKQMPMVTTTLTKLIFFDETTL